MTIKDAPSGRVPDTAMRDYLRRLEREANANYPARPTVQPPPPPTTGNPDPPAASLSDETGGVSVGRWRLRDDPLSGDLVAIDPDGTTHILIARGEP